MAKAGHILFWLFIGFLVFLIGGLLLNMHSGNNPSPSHTAVSSSAPASPVTHASTTSVSAPTYNDLHGKVVFTGTEFIITNADSYTWENVLLNLNGGTWSYGCTYRVKQIPPGTWHIDVSNFAKKDGTIFNPLTTKPLRLEISTYDATGKMTGYGAIDWSK